MTKDKHNQSALQRLSTRIGWQRAKMAKHNIYRSGPLGRTAWGKFQLPGLAAASQLSEYKDSYGRPFALLFYPSTRHFTVVINAEPDGASLVDEDQIDIWVAHWGQWLASLGHEPGIVAASVTVESAPDTGIRLRREVSHNMQDGTAGDRPGDAHRGRADLPGGFGAGLGPGRADLQGHRPQRQAPQGRGHGPRARVPAARR